MWGRTVIIAVILVPCFVIPSGAKDAPVFGGIEFFRFQPNFELDSDGTFLKHLLAREIRFFTDDLDPGWGIGIGTYDFSEGGGFGLGAGAKVAWAGGDIHWEDRTTQVSFPTVDALLLDFDTLMNIAYRFTKGPVQPTIYGGFSIGYSLLKVEIEGDAEWAGSTDIGLDYGLEFTTFRRRVAVGYRGFFNNILPPSPPIYRVEAVSLITDYRQPCEIYVRINF